VSFTATPGDTVCKGMAVELSAVPVYGGTSPAFTWAKDGSAIGTGASFSYIPSNGDLVTCFMVSDYPCLLADTVTGQPVAMVVEDPTLPSVSITANPGTTVGRGKAVALTAVVTGGGPNPTYQWYVDGVPVPGATNQSYTKTSPDTSFEDSVSVVVATGGFCPTSTHGWVYIEVDPEGVAGLANAVGVSVLPNPSDGTFTIKGTIGKADGELGIEVTDLLGQVVYQGTAQAPGGKVNQTVTLGNGTANGMYLLNLHTATGNLVVHIVVGR
jgi:hypothetical protein